MPEVAIAAVTNANRKVVKIVFLIANISSPPPDLRPACQTLCQRSVFSLAGLAKGRPGHRDRLKMIRTADSPSNNAEENRTVLRVWYGSMQKPWQLERETEAMQGKVRLGLWMKLLG